MYDFFHLSSLPKWENIAELHPSMLSHRDAVLLLLQVLEPKME